jgi:hypothetical protein
MFAGIEIGENGLKGPLGRPECGLLIADPVGTGGEKGLRASCAGLCRLD